MEKKELEKELNEEEFAEEWERMKARSDYLNFMRNSPFETYILTEFLYEEIGYSEFLPKVVKKIVKWRKAMEQKKEVEIFGYPIDNYGNKVIFNILLSSLIADIRRTFSEEEAEKIIEDSLKMKKYKKIIEENFEIECSGSYRDFLKKGYTDLVESVTDNLLKQRKEK